MESTTPASPEQLPQSGAQAVLGPSLAGDAAASPASQASLAAPHVYYTRDRTFRWLVAAWLAIIGLAMLANMPIPVHIPTTRVSSGHLDPATAAAFRILGGFVAVLAGVGWAYLAAITRLVVTAEGIKYYDVGARRPSLIASWSQVESIQRTTKGTELLVLANPGQRCSLTQFGSDWRTSQLGQDLQAHAPQLFKDR